MNLLHHRKNIKLAFIFWFLMLCSSYGHDFRLHKRIKNSISSDSKLVKDASRPKCQSGFVDGVCTYSLECKNSQQYARSPCWKNFQVGVCCTNRTTLSLIGHASDKKPTKESKYNDCGQLIVYPSLVSKIVNGTKGLYGQFPWTVSLRLSIKPDNKSYPSHHFCGGTLLNNEWVVTSAHCVLLEDMKYLVLRIGEFDSNSTTEPDNYVERSVAKKISHKNFRLKDYYSDISLLKLSEPVEFGPHIQPICLPGNKDTLAGLPGTVSGWGRVTEDGKPSNIIRMVSLPIMTNKECEEMFKKGFITEDIYSVFLCAGFEDGSKDACTGDSGGPLQVKGEDGRIFLAGVVSWGYGCSRPYKPGVYTRVSEFVPWIRKVISAE